MRRLDDLGSEGSGIAIPADHPPTENELAWIGFMRLITRGSDPKPTLALVQQVRSILEAA